MNYEKVFIPTLRRLSQLVSKQYGCRFEYLNDMDLRKSENPELVKQLIAGTPAMTENGMFFPILPNGVLMGAAYVAGHRKLGQTEVSSLNQVVRMVLESTLLNVERLDTIEVLELQLERLNDDPDQNLISLADRRPQKIIDVDVNKSRLKERLSFPFLVEAQSEEDAFRMALEIHDHSGRRFFAPIEDLDTSAFADAGALREMGPISVYATCFEYLSPEVQQVWLDYFAGPRGRGCPQLIVGTTRSYSELKLDTEVNNDFLAKLTVGYLFLSQPFSVYKSGDILEFFFDSLTGRSQTHS